MQTSVISEEIKPLQQQSFISEIEIGLLARPAYISPKFLYDPLGSHLFTAITLLPEYYPSNTEKNILDHYANEISNVIGANGILIDLGAGNCQKAEALFNLIKPATYVAIDFSVEYLEEALNKLQGKYPKIKMRGIGMDFSRQLEVLDSIPMSRRTFFYPGSSIGNFLTSEARKLLTEIKNQTGDGGLLIGVDLMKEDSILREAYDDPLKVTAAFNLNILRSVNAHLGSNFNVKQFQHLVKINHQENRVELYLQTLEDVTVSWPGNNISLKEGDLIHTENSHKYTVESIKQLLKSAGFESNQIWTDPKQYFALIYAQ